MYQIKISQFEGPLDLLLKLIEKEKLDITEVYLAAISDKFLAYLEYSEPETQELIDFLEVFVKLLLIKSRLLIPGEIQEEEAESLATQLKIYRHFWLASRKILKLFSQVETGFAKEKIPSGFFKNLSCQIRLEPKDLRESLENVLSRLTPLERKEISKKRKISLEEKISELLALLNKCQELNLNSIFITKSKCEKVFLFLALLHVLKEKKARVRQEKLFGQIVIQKYAL